MAIVYPQADLTPSKKELMDAWLPTRSWFDGHRTASRSARSASTTPRARSGWKGSCSAARGCRRYFLPLTYRSAELDGAEEHLVGTTEHSELGPAGSTTAAPTRCSSASSPRRS